MGIDTRAYYPNVSKKQIIDFLHIISKKVNKENTYDNVKGVEGLSTIDFELKGEQRSMHMHDVVIDVEKDEAKTIKKYKKAHESESWLYVKQDKLPDHTSGTTVSVGYWGSAVQLFTIMAYLWGGYVDEQDTDSEPHYKIKKDHKALIRYLFGGNSK